MKNFISVRFGNNTRNTSWDKAYQFLTDIKDLAYGEAVVVDTANGLQIAYVIGYDEDSKVKGNNFKWVVQRINLEHHQERMTQEEKKKKLKQKMEQRRKKLEEIQIFEILAKEDEDMKLLLEEYNSLSF